ncbi:MAG: hypothetical protein AB8H47_29400 [Bacteroidia bacterium]
MKMTVPMHRSLLFVVFSLLTLSISWAQVETEIIIRDCTKIPCFTKSPKKTLGNPIMPPDYPFTFMVNLSNVTQASGGLGSMGGELRLGFAPKRTYEVKSTIVADEQYARKNGLNNNVVHQEVLFIHNAKTPYYEIGARLTNLNFENLSSISGGRSFQLQYLDIVPLGMRYELGKRFSLGLGTSISMLTSATLDGREITDLERSGFNRWEPGLMLNLQYGKRGRGLQAGFTYNQRFSYLSETSLRYGITQFSIGWGLGGKR